MTLPQFPLVQAFALVVAMLGSASSRAASSMDSLPSRGTWVRTADAPLSARNYASVAWTGSEILVFGGVEFACPITTIKGCPPQSTPVLSDGAAYNALTDSWRKIADAPVNIMGSHTATAGDAIFVLASTGANLNPKRLLRYRPRLDSWDELEPPENMFSSAITASGPNTLLYYADSDEHQPAHDWRLNIATGVWMRLPDDPFGPGYGRQFVTLRENLYLFKRVLEQSADGAKGRDRLHVARLRRQQWEILPVSFGIGPNAALVADSRIIFPVLGCEPDSEGRCIDFGAVLDTETETWQELPDPPARGPRYVGSSGGMSDDNLVLIQPGYPALDATTNEWFIVPALDADMLVQRYVQAVGPYGFTFGGVSSTVELLGDAWIWKP